MATSMETTHMETIHKRHRFKVRRETRNGNTTATKRSTAITTKLWTDSSKKTSAKYGVILHVILATTASVMTQECRWKYTRLTGITIKENRRSGMVKLTYKKVDWFSQSWRFANDYCYQGISEERNDNLKRMQRAMVTPIFCSARLNVTGQLDSFLNAFMN